MLELVQQVLSEARSAWRFRWYAVAAAWVVGLVGLAVVAWLPNVYEGIGEDLCRRILGPASATQ